MDLLIVDKPTRRKSNLISLLMTLNPIGLNSLTFSTTYIRTLFSRRALFKLALFKLKHLVGSKTPGLNSHT